MFGFGKKLYLARYEVRNPRCAPIFHALVNDAYLAAGLTTDPRFSEGCFEDDQVRHGLEDQFVKAFKRKREVGVERHMAEVAQLHLDVLNETMLAGPSDDPDQDGFLLAVMAIRMIAFGNAGGVAVNPDNALAITADILFSLARDLRWMPERTLPYHYGATMKRFGLQFDAPVWSRCPLEVAENRRREWEECYPKGNLSRAA